MAIPEFMVDMNIISKLGEYPGSDNGLTSQGFKAQFDKAGLFIKEYINTILLPELNMMVDVEALLNGILDETLTQPDKAAPAKKVGDILKLLEAQLGINQALFFSKTVQSGDYVLGTDQQFNAAAITANEVRVYGGEAVAQGHLMSLNIGSYASVPITSGLYGTYRNDLICARFERDAEGNETHSIAVIEGTQNQIGGVDPAYNQGDINTLGAAVYDVPLYRVVLTGVDVALEPLFTVQKNLVDAVIAQLSRWEGGSY